VDNKLSLLLIAEVNDLVCVEEAKLWADVESREHWMKDYSEEE
jgi:hypothetical protein